MKTNSPRWTLVATSFGLGMALLDVTAGNVAVPSIQRDFGTGIAGLSWVIDGYTLAFASALVLAGGLGDRLGTRRVFASGLVLFTVASLLCGVAPTVGLLIAARVLQGLGAALFMPSSLALLARAYPDPGQRARAIGFWSALTAITGGSGPLVGGILTSTLGWRSIFLVNLPLGITGVLMTARFVRPTAPSRARTLDLPAQLVAALSLGSVTWALVERAERGWGSPAVLGALLAGVVGLALFIWMESTAAEPMLPPRLFQHRTFATTSAGALLYAAAFFGGLLVLSLYFQRVRGEAAALAGLHISAITVTFGLASILGGKLAGRHGPRASILLGLVLLCRRRLRSVTGHRGHVVPDPRASARAARLRRRSRRPADERGHPRQCRAGSRRDRQRRAQRQPADRHGARRGGLRLPLRRRSVTAPGSAAGDARRGGALPRGRGRGGDGASHEEHCARCRAAAGLVQERRVGRASPVPGLECPAVHQPPHRLRRTLGWGDGLALVVGIMVGSGIFRTPGLVASSLGRPALTFVAWALGGAVGLLGALIFAELATRHPHAGGKYVYARESFGRRAGFVVGWVEALTYCAAVAAIAVVCGDYLSRLVGWPPRSHRPSESCSSSP